MRFRFTIRDLLWLTALIAMGMAWWLDHRAIQRQSANEFNALREDFSRLRGQVIRAQMAQSTSAKGREPIPEVPPMKVAP